MYILHIFIIISEKKETFQQKRTRDDLRGKDIETGFFFDYNKSGSARIRQSSSAIKSRIVIGLPAEAGLEYF